MIECGNADIIFSARWMVFWCTVQYLVCHWYHWSMSFVNFCCADCLFLLEVHSTRTWWRLQSVSHWIRWIFSSLSISLSPPFFLYIFYLFMCNVSLLRYLCCFWIPLFSDDCPSFKFFCCCAGPGYFWFLGWRSYWENQFSARAG